MIPAEHNDPLDPLAYDIVILPHTHTHRVDSISWNPHKMMGAPLQCAAFITKEKVASSLVSSH